MRACVRACVLVCVTLVCVHNERTWKAHSRMHFSLNDASLLHVCALWAEPPGPLLGPCWRGMQTYLE